MESYLVNPIAVSENSFQSSSFLPRKAISRETCQQGTDKD